jgi:hypothetical protein
MARIGLESFEGQGMLCCVVPGLPLRPVIVEVSFFNFDLVYCLLDDSLDIPVSYV